MTSHGGVTLAFKVLLFRSTELSRSPTITPLKLMDRTPSPVSSTAAQDTNGLPYPQSKDVSLYWIKLRLWLDMGMDIEYTRRKKSSTMNGSKSMELGCSESGNGAEPTEQVC